VAGGKTTDHICQCGKASTLGRQVAGRVVDGGDGAAGGGGGGGGGQGAAGMGVIVASTAGFVLIAAGVALLVALRRRAALHGHSTDDADADTGFETTVAAMEEDTTNLEWDDSVLPRAV